MNVDCDFTLCALALLALLFVRAWARRRIANVNARVFRLMLGTGLMTVGMELSYALLMRAARPELAWLMLIVRAAMCAMQLVLPMMLLYYARSLRPIRPRKDRGRLLLGAVPALISSVLVLIIAVRAGGFEAEAHAPLHTVIGTNSAVYMLAAAGYTLRSREASDSGRLNAVLSFVVLMGVCLIAQLFIADRMIMGFGFALGATLLGLTINNPSGYLDNLTGIFDKPYFEQWIGEELLRGAEFHLLAADLFNLKQINETYGSAVGDKLLAGAAKELRGLGEHALVFRISGKRFVLATHSLTEYELCRSQMQLYFGGLFDIDGETVQLPALLCGVMHAERLEGSDALLGYIDHLASLAPQAEKTTLVQGDEKTMEGYRYRLDVESYMHRALEDELFELAFQPLYSLKDGRYVSVEVLSRLRHPTLGFVPPDLFIDIAEKNGQIVKLGYQQFRKLCRFLCGNPDIFAKVDNVKFNLSPSELLKYGYGRTLIETIRDFGLPFERFQFEITETIATKYSKELFRVIQEFLEAGIRLCLDDFGSGFANLNAVLRMPFTCVKLDRSMLFGIEEDEQVAKLYRNMVQALQNLGYTVVAEGVEDEKERELLASFGVDLIQGYLFSPPLSEEELRGALEKDGN